jgi:hypothetical protein
MSRVDDSGEVMIHREADSSHSDLRAHALGKQSARENGAVSTITTERYQGGGCSPAD